MLLHCCCPGERCGGQPRVTARLRMDLRDRRKDLRPTGPWRLEKRTPVGKEDLGLNAAKNDQ